MDNTESPDDPNLIHIVSLDCKDADHARRCLEALANDGRPDALAYNCRSYEFGLQEGIPTRVVLVERGSDWGDLDALLMEKVVPALPNYNQLLREPFDPVTCTTRIRLSGV